MAYWEKNDLNEIDLMADYSNNMIHFDIQDDNESLEELESANINASSESKDLDFIMANLFSAENSVVRRKSASIDSRTDSALANLIDNRIQTKALPLALRKRLMYERKMAEQSIA